MPATSRTSCSPSGLQTAGATRGSPGGNVVSAPVAGLKNDTFPPREKARVDPSGDHDGSDESGKLVTTVPVAGSRTTSTGVGAAIVPSSSTTASQPPPGDSAAAA